MAVIPVRARLRRAKAIGEGFTRPDARKTDARDAIHVERQQNAVPVDGGIFVQGVGHVQGDLLTLLPAQKWRW